MLTTVTSEKSDVQATSPIRTRRVVNHTGNQSPNPQGRRGTITDRLEKDDDVAANTRTTKYRSAVVSWTHPTATDNVGFRWRKVRRQRNETEGSTGANVSSYGTYNHVLDTIDGTPTPGGHYLTGFDHYQGPRASYKTATGWGYKPDMSDISVDGAATEADFANFSGRSKAAAAQ